MLKSVRSTYALLTGASLLAMGAASPALAQQTGIEEIVVTAEKRAASIQDVPIAVSAFSQDTLEVLQIDGGPNLQLAIPNVNFSKGNFTGYNFQIRGVGTKLVTATADAATGVHLNGAPLTANNLFEAEFFDVERVEVLRGPQGTLYGRNATGGVVNVITAKPTSEFEAFAQGTVGDFGTRRLEGMVNLPIGDAGGLRIAGAQLQRDGFATNATSGRDIDSRDLWAVRATLGLDMSENARVWLSYEHFEEDDSRLRSGKQLCIKDPGDTSVGGVPVGNALLQGFLSQGCLPGNVLNSRQTVNSSATLGGLLGNLTGLVSGDAFAGKSVPQDLRTIESAFDPLYRASSEVYTLNFEWDVTDSITLTSLTSHSNSSVFSHEDYNKVIPNGTFNTIPSAPFNLLFPGGVVNDPQLGASNKFRTFDLSRGDNSQTTTELRLQSSFDGPLNFNIGGILIDFETTTDYYVFSNTLTANAQLQNFFATLPAGAIPGTATGPGVAVPIDTSNPNGATIDQRINDSGRNYFLSRTPYFLDAYALFGELYWDVSSNFKITTGVRYTSDEKKVINNSTALLANVATLPTALTAPNNAFLTDPVRPTATTSFEEVTGRAGFDWKPDLGFSDETLIYAFYSRGYKGGGLNPPPAVGVAPIRPTYEPEFVNAIEVGAKNTFADGRFQLNATAFNYDYKGYQVSKIVNRTSLNENIDAEIRGLEFESIWAPTERLLFTANVGYLKTEIVGGQSVDLIDRTQGDPTLSVVKASNASNCVVPTAGLATLLAVIQGLPGAPNVTGVTGNPLALLGACSNAFTAFGVTASEGIEVKLAGKELPNSPEWTTSFGAQYTQPLTENWALVARGDYYWQAESFARIYNKAPFDVVPDWQNANFSLALTNDESQIEVKAFVKNAFNDDVVTDKYLTDDSSGLFSNVFLLEPRTYGVTVSKRF